MLHCTIHYKQGAGTFRASIHGCPGIRNVVPWTSFLSCEWSPPHWAKVPCDSQQVEVLGTICVSGLLTIWSTVRFLPPPPPIPEMFEMVLYGLWISTLHVLVVVIVIFMLLKSIRRHMLYEQNKMEMTIKRVFLGLICNKDGSGRFQ